MLNFFRKNIEKVSKVKTDYDIVIIGGGLSGLYTAYRLMKSTNYKIGLFEKESVLGGKIVTEKVDDFLIEYGPQKLEPGLETRVMKLIYELDIDIKKLDKKKGNNIIFPDITKLNSNEIEICNVYKYSGNNIPLHILLLKDGLTLILGDQWNFNYDIESTTDRDIRKGILRKFGKYKEINLFNYGILDLLKIVLSEECFQYILSEGDYYYILDENPNAAEYICILLDIIESYKWDYVLIEGGIISIIHKLNNIIRDKVDIKLDYLLNSIESYSPNVISLNFTNVFSQKKIYCRHLILAIPPDSLNKLNGIPSNIIKLIESSFLKIDLIKIFIVVENPPWGNEKVDLIKIIPCKQIEYFWNSKKNTTAILLYCDKDIKDCILKNSYEAIIEKLNSLFEDKYPNKSGWKIRVYDMNNWSNMCNRRLYLWKPNIKCDEVIMKLLAFPIKEKYKPRIHICGETVSNFQCFIEGSLSSVENIERSLVHKKGTSQRFSTDTLYF
jgi:hypothetical protein